MKGFFVDKQRGDRQRGFTLAEVMLVLVIGAILLGAATMLYNQIRSNAGHSAAWNKVMGLQMVVEDLAVSKDQTYPTIDELRGAWSRRRTNDFANSPWGGTVIANDGSLPNVHFGILGGDRDPGLYTTDPNLGDSGILYYWRQNPNNPAGFLNHADLSKGGETVRTRFYMVGIAGPLGDRYFYVTGPQAGNDDQGGQVGN